MHHRLASLTRLHPDFETTRDVNEGLQHYRWLHDEELKKIVKPGWFGGEVSSVLHDVMWHLTPVPGQSQTRIRQGDWVWRARQWRKGEASAAVALCVGHVGAGTAQGPARVQAHLL